MNFCGTELQLQVYMVHNKYQKELGAFGKNYKWILNTLLVTVQKSVFANSFHTTFHDSLFVLETPDKTR